MTSASTYDELGWVTAATITADGTSRATTYGYDAGGHQLWSQGPDGVRRTNRYDELGRVSAVLAFDGQATATLSRTVYDAASGRRTSATSSRPSRTMMR